jgi:hypothetical protein
MEFSAIPANGPTRSQEFGAAFNVVAGATALITAVACRPPICSRFAQISAAAWLSSSLAQALELSDLAATKASLTAESAKWANKAAVYREDAEKTFLSAKDRVQGAWHVLVAPRQRITE